MSSYHSYSRNAEEKTTPLNKLTQVQDQANAVTDQMRHNIQLTIARGQDLELLDDKARILEDNARIFQKNAKELRWMMCRRNWKLICLILIILAAIIGFIILFYEITK